MIFSIFRGGLLALLASGALFLGACARESGEPASLSKASEEITEQIDGRAEAEVVQVNGETKVLAHLGFVEGGLERGDTVRLRFPGQEEAVGVVQLVAVDVQKEVDRFPGTVAGPEVAIVDVPDNLETELRPGQQGEIEITELTQR